MFNPPTPYTDAPLPPRASPYAGPERRNAQSMLWRWLAAALDEVDYGILLVVNETHVAHSNHAAQAQLGAEHPVQLIGHQLHVRCPQDAAPLRGALADAARRGLRRLLTLGDEAHQVCVAVVPLPAFGRDPHPAALLVFGKRVCEQLSVHWLASAHGLTPAERRVLEALCNGSTPNEIAQRQRMSISTVRTQIRHIRTKTGAESVCELVRQVAAPAGQCCARRGNGARQEG